MKELREFAAETKGKSVAFLVQAATIDKTPAKKNDDDKAAAKKTDLDTSQQQQQKPGSGETANSRKKSETYHVDRYLISNGQITKLSTSPSAGYAKDVESLMRLASKNYRCDRLGWVQDSHGQGNEGLLGDTGKVSLSQFKKAITEGLAGSGRDALDLLNFDACLMGQNGVMRNLRSISKDIVASEEIVQTAGQHLTTVFHHLLNKPKMTGGDLAEDFIATARSHAPGPEDKDGWTSTQTLAHYKTDEYKHFQTALNNLGTVLSDHLKQPGGRAAIGKVIDGTRRLNDWGDSAEEWDEGNTEDLKVFVANLKRAIADGSVEDGDGKLKKSVGDVEAQLDRLVISFFGDYHNNEYWKGGGLSVFLPKASIRDIDTGARLRTTAGRVAVQASECAVDPLAWCDKQQYLESLDSRIKSAEEELKGKPEFRESLASLRKFYGAMRDAKNISKFMRASNNLACAAKELEKSPYFTKQRAGAQERLKKETKDLYSIEVVDSDTGWGRFQLDLRDSQYYRR